MQRCTTQATYENRVDAYNVVYDYADKRYQVQMPHDLGRTIQLNVSPVVGSMSPARHLYQVILTQDSPREHRMDRRFGRRDDWQDNHSDWNYER